MVAFGFMDNSAARRQRRLHAPRVMQTESQLVGGLLLGLPRCASGGTRDSRFTTHAEQGWAIIQVHF